MYQAVLILLINLGGNSCCYYYSRSVDEELRHGEEGPES